MAELITVQASFAAVGHLAQSLLNTANASRGADEIRYLVSQEDRHPSLQLDVFSLIAHVDYFKVNGPEVIALL